MSTVYSTRFVLASTTGPTTYQVGAGKRAVVKCIDAWNSNAAANTLYLALAGKTIQRVPLAAVSGVSHWEGLQVLYAGEVISVAFDLGGANAMVSGYLFSDP